MEPNPVAELAARIGRKGKITFAEFMEVALYYPQGGYYTEGINVGASGDFYTSPTAHPAFGALIAVQLRTMWDLLGRPSPFYAIEVGAGSGTHARDVVEYSRALSSTFIDALVYIALDRCPRPYVLKVPKTIYQRLTSVGIPLRGVVGCFVSNELVDSFPVHRFKIEGTELKEVYVSLDGSRFVETLDVPSTGELSRRLARLGKPLPDGYQGEVNLRLRPWMADVASSLGRGFVLTIDYGDISQGHYAPNMAGGTMQTHYRHTSGSSVYQRVGAQDITAHVDFSQVAYEGDQLGLRPLWLGTQSQFLRCLGLDKWLRRLRVRRMSQVERDSNAMAMRDLISADGLGGFKVLIQEKNTGVSDPEHLFQSANESEAADSTDGGLPLPLLGPDHVALMAGRYPHSQWQPEELWPGRPGVESQP